MKTLALNKRLAGTLAVAVAAGLTTAVLPATSADAGRPRCILRISGATPFPNGETRRRVTHNCPRVAPGDQMVYLTMWGDDWPDADDKLYTRRSHILNESYVVPEVVLNEDAATWDELYMVAKFQRPNGTYYSLRSNMVHGEFFPFD